MPKLSLSVCPVAGRGRSRAVHLGDRGGLRAAAGVRLSVLGVFALDPLCPAPHPARHNERPNGAWDDQGDVTCVFIRVLMGS